MITLSLTWLSLSLVLIVALLILVWVVADGRGFNRAKIRYQQEAFDTGRVSALHHLLRELERGLHYADIASPCRQLLVLMIQVFKDRTVESKLGAADFDGRLLRWSEAPLKQLLRAPEPETVIVNQKYKPLQAVRSTNVVGRPQDRRRDEEPRPISSTTDDSTSVTYLSHETHPARAQAFTGLGGAFGGAGASGSWDSSSSDSSSSSSSDSSSSSSSSDSSSSSSSSE